jgi:hypothetical protein
MADSDACCRFLRSPKHPEISNQKVIKNGPPFPGGASAFAISESNNKKAPEKFRAQLQP